jgi:hypothetical protein
MFQVEPEAMETAAQSNNMDQVVVWHSANSTDPNEFTGRKSLLQRGHGFSSKSRKQTEVSFVLFNGDTIPEYGLDFTRMGRQRILSTTMVRRRRRPAGSELLRIGKRSMIRHLPFYCERAR